MSKDEGLKKLLNFPFERDYRYAVEVRHKTWFDKEVYDAFEKLGICLAWSQREELPTPPTVTTDFSYLRFIGDRSIDEKDFGKIQKDRTKEMQKWAKVIKETSKQDKNRIIIIPANNHYAGYGPMTANGFRKMVGLKEAAWEEMKQARLD
jgi:uncharacterized protein YecE (DUF72 family)